MDNLNDLKKLWQTADTQSLPDSKEMVLLIKKYRNQKIVKKSILIGCAIILVVVMIWVVFVYKSTMITTRIGEALILSAISILIFTNTKSLKRMYDLKNSTNKEFLAHLEQAQYNRNYFYKKTQLVCMGLNGAGFILYMIETINRDPFKGSIVLVITIIFLLFLLLVVRPYMFKKQTEKFNETVRKTQLLSKQLDEL